MSSSGSEISSRCSNESSWLGEGEEWLAPEGSDSSIADEYGQFLEELMGDGSPKLEKRARC